MKRFQGDPWLQSEGEFDGKDIWQGYSAVGTGNQTYKVKTEPWKAQLLICILGVM